MKIDKGASWILYNKYYFNYNLFNFSFFPAQLYKLVVIIILLFVYSLILLTSLTRLMFNYSNPITYSKLIMKKINNYINEEMPRKTSKNYYFPRSELTLLFSYITDIVIKLTVKYEISAAIEILNEFYKLINSSPHVSEIKNLLFRTVMGEYLRIIKTSIKSDDTYKINEEILVRIKYLIEFNQSKFEAIENFFGLNNHSNYYYKFIEIFLEKDQVELFRKINWIFLSLNYINIFNTRKLDLFFIKNISDISETIMSHENINFFKEMVSILLNIEYNLYNSENCYPYYKIINSLIYECSSLKNAENNRIIDYPLIKVIDEIIISQENHDTILSEKIFINFLTIIFYQTPQKISLQLSKKNVIPP